MWNCMGNMKYAEQYSTLYRNNTIDSLACNSRKSSGETNEGSTSLSQLFSLWADLIHMLFMHFFFLVRKETTFQKHHMSCSHCYHNIKALKAFTNTLTHFHPLICCWWRQPSGGSPDILIAVDVDSVELMLEVFVLYICHVVDHFQNYKTWQDW